MDKLEAVQDHINSLTGGMDGYTSSGQAFRRFDPTHPFGIAMLLAILLAGLLPPCKKLSARAGGKAPPAPWPERKPAALEVLTVDSDSDCHRSGCGGGGRLPGRLQRPVRGPAGH